jgi:hypothetical protein
MNAKRLVTCLILPLATLAAPPWAAAQAPRSAEDLLSPLVGGSSKIAEPDQVKVEPGKVKAASAQDAANAAVVVTVKALAKDPTATGTVEMQFPSGMGYVSTGSGSYTVFDGNRTATLNSKRNAYLAAFFEAKKHLARTLTGLSVESKDTLRQSLENLNLPDKQAANLKVKGEESLKQAVEMMLRGFVVYEVRDDPGAKTIYVTIVTTPQTRRKLTHPAPNAIDAENLVQGVDQVLAELKAGVVPPVGGRIIQVRDTGETALIGFGSAIVGQNENATLQTKLILEAKKIAQMRAHDSLLGLLKGEDLCWKGGVVAQYQQEIKQFELKNPDDPIAASPDQVKILDKERATYFDLVKSNEEYRSVREGKLPPGLVDSVWLDGNRDWAFAISIFSPSRSKKAKKAADEIRDSGQSFAPNLGTPRIGPVPQGPTGRVTKDSELP